MTDDTKLLARLGWDHLEDRDLWVNWDRHEFVQGETPTVTLEDIVGHFTAHGWALTFITSAGNGWTLQARPPTGPPPYPYELTMEPSALAAARDLMAAVDPTLSYPDRVPDRSVPGWAGPHLFTNNSYPETSGERSLCCGFSMDELVRNSDGGWNDIRWTWSPAGCTCPHYKRVPTGTEPNPPTHEPANRR